MKRLMACSALLADAWRGHAPDIARAGLVAVLVAAPAGPAYAQQTDTTRAAPQADTVRAAPGTSEDALRRLRALRPLTPPDTTAPVAEDTTAPAAPASPAGSRAGAQRGADARSGIQHDSIMLRLLALPGYTATEYVGGRASFDTDSARLELRDSPIVVRDGQKLEADSTVVYWERLARACGYGRPEFSGRGVEAPVVSDSLCYDLQRGYGVAMGAETTVTEGALWRVRGDVYFDPVTGAAYGHDAIFTDCDLPFPHVHYHFAAKSMKVNPNNVMVARDVTLRFADVPVFWLPFMVQSLASGRRSGLLMPRFGINDIARNSPRYNRRVEDIGFYWAINDYMGTELALDWFSNNWTALRGSLDYRWRERFLNGGLTYRRYWRDSGSREFTVSTYNTWQPDERTNVIVSGNYATSTTFVRQQSYDPHELDRTIDSNAGINRRFDWGTVNTTLSRRQALHDNTVRTVLPSLFLNINPITLFEALPGEERFFSNMTWSGNARTNVDRTSIPADHPSTAQQGHRKTATSLSSSFNMGGLSWSQSLTLDDEIRHARSFGSDSIADLPERALNNMGWDTSLRYQQRLIGTSTLEPGLTISGGTLRSDATDGETVDKPVRMDFGATLRTEMFGFWPGVGPFELFRHRVSPQLTYSYVPRPAVTDRQREVFGIGDVRERNELQISLSQTWEGRYRPRAETREPANGGRQGIVPPGDAEVDAADAGAADAGAAEPEHEADPFGTGDPEDGPRRREQPNRVSLLSITTSAIAYDFVSARQDGRGLQTTTISNHLHSDLLRGMQISMAHDLFRPVLGEDGSTTGDREFAPHLSTVTAGFSLNNDSWLFRVLGLGGGGDGDGTEARTVDEQLNPDIDPTIDPTRSERGMVGPGRRGAALSGPAQRVGTWSASFNYSLLRPRPEAKALGQLENQMLTANMLFQPSPLWNVRWSTGYSFTTREFSQHVLTLTRRMHDWDANFDFVRAQNGNFSFMFRVALRANPDIKLDYEQRGDPTGPARF